MKAFSKATSGNSVLEFTLSSIPLIFIILSSLQMSVAMWNYHTLNETVNITTRVVALRGADCASAGCSMTVGGITTMVANKGIGLVPASLNVSLTDATGSITCHPVTTCESSTTVFPRSGGNSVGQVVAISASYPFNSAIAMFVPGVGAQTFDSLTFTAISQQVIYY
jgi:hypothetical protein